ncbi:hypothetical protein SDRG_16573 [Saprolegnia diclina VS20]|uniref:Uncharacterized protein n=1 Tax=Saprolegnia diclina (strain VS20) TaxID=1156394 RepID=T0PX11_SAPDV|nr:hypothetical protein SDRG_16573 [Saprolegnia diclina VS20]EQC25555.1 hypothetical protein SDRG_16573 [Saprolegnia diclina VS20]|eukprot:XP_008621011.1 hypothetical protein SDRG_16573 [Saprolegnia diclina VS20]
MSSFVTSMLATAATASAADEKARRLFTPHMLASLTSITQRKPASPAREASGWDFEHKMAALLDLQDALEAATFNYKDFGDLPPISRKPLALLTLVQGQDALLDLWAFFLEMCDVVPARTGARGLLLRLAGCMCRRLEFTELVSLHGVTLEMEPSVKTRIQGLLLTSLQYCGNKLEKSRILTQDHAYFASHVYTAAIYRFPVHVGQPILRAIATYATELATLPAPGFKKTPSKGATTSTNLDATVWFCAVVDSTAPTEKASEQNDHCRADGFDRETSADAAIAAYDMYILRCPRREYESHRMLSTVRETLDNALAATTDDGHAFIHACPQLHTAVAAEAALWTDRPLDAAVISAATTPFLDRLATPTRDSILCAAFLSTFIEDSVVWSSVLAPSIAWRCLPGYDIIIHAFVQVFRKVAGRRKKASTALFPPPPQPASPYRSTLASNATKSDPWAPYWAPNELEPIYDGLGDILGNDALLNVFVQIVLEGINLYDPQSVDYGFNLLQRVLEASAYNHRASSADDRGQLPESLDIVVYLGALRSALASSHFQILLKVLAFFYATIDLFDSTRRRRVVSELLLHDHFFQLFLHWNEEVRRMYAHVLVYKLFTSHRFDLPLVSDRVLLAPSPFFRLYNAPTPTFLAGLAHLLGPQKLQTTTFIRPPDHGAALERLLVWDTSATLRQATKQDQLFRDSLADDALMLDLSIASKLDALLKMVAEQVGGVGFGYYPAPLMSYAKKAVSQYVGLLWGYYQSAFEDPIHRCPNAPDLEFTVQNFFGAD